MVHESMDVESVLCNSDSILMNSKGVLMAVLRKLIGDIHDNLAVALDEVQGGEDLRTSDVVVR